MAISSVSRVAFLWLCCICALANFAGAHPFHVSVAEMEFNRTSGRFEISLKIQSTDLERYLSQVEKRRIDLESDKDADKLIQSCLERHFYIAPLQSITESNRDKSSGTEVNEPSTVAKSTVHWAGKEFKTTWLWIYFELELPKASGPLGLMNSLLLDVTDGQINTVTIRMPNQRKSVRTDIKMPWVALDPAWYAAE